MESKLTIRDVFEMMDTNAEVETVIFKFAVATVVDLLETNSKDWESEFLTKEQDFYDARKSTLPEASAHLPLTNDTYLDLKYVPMCKFVFSEVDESEVGLGSAGSISGIESCWFEITGMFYLTADGSELDLSASLELKDFFSNRLNIQQ